MATTLLAQYSGSSPATSHTVTFDTPSAPGSDVLVFANAAAVITAPSGDWVKDYEYLNNDHGTVFRLPGEDNPGISSATFGLSASYRLTVVAVQTYITGAPTYSEFTTSTGNMVSDGTVWGTGLHNFAAQDEAFAVFWRTTPGSFPPFTGRVASLDQGFTVLGQAATTGAPGVEHGWVALGHAESVSLDNDGVTATVDPAETDNTLQSHFPGSVKPGVITYEARVPAAILTTAAGSADAVGGTGSMLGQGDATLTTTAGSADAVGGAGVMLGASVATLTTTVGSADAVGGSGSLVAEVAFGATLPLEVALPGAPSTEWEITGYGALEVQGFARQFSVDVGETVDFAVDGTGCTVVDIYRIGGYDTGWRKVGSATNTPTSQPEAATIADSNGATTCAGWATTASWTVPAGAWSGLYVGVARITGNGSWIPFVVRNDSRAADVVVKTSETTWGMAYNWYNTPSSPTTGKSVYGSGGPLGDITSRSLAVTLDRPVLTRGGIAQTYWSAMEAPYLRFLDKQGIDYKVISSADLDEGLATTGDASVLVSVGHDEYWSQGMRDNAEAFRDAGGHLVFMSANEVFWRIRFTPDRRTFWCYKDTMPGPGGHTAGAPLDPVSWTGTWRDTRWAQNEPENLLTGTYFRMNGVRDETASVNAATYGASPFWRGTTVASGTNLSLPRVVGFEADSMAPTRPASVAVAATSINIDGSYTDDNGQTYNNDGTLDWGIVLQLQPSGSVVAGFGTNQWGWALDGEHDRTNTTPSVAAQQATLNLLADMGAVAATPTAGLVAPTPVGWDDYGLVSTLTTVTGDAAAVGGDGTMLVGSLFGTLTGAGEAAGAVTTLTGGAGLATVTGTAEAAGGAAGGGGASATLATVTADAAAVGGVTVFTALPYNRVTPRPMTGITYRP